MTEGEEGFLLDDPGDDATLAGKMKELLEPAQREKMGAAGRAMALRHTFAQQTTKFLDLYAQIVAAKS